MSFYAFIHTPHERYVGVNNSRGDFDSHAPTPIREFSGSLALTYLKYRQTIATVHPIVSSSDYRAAIGSYLVRRVLIVSTPNRTHTHRPSDRRIDTLDVDGRLQFGRGRNPINWVAGRQEYRNTDGEELDTFHGMPR
jgi:hypothetical protein